MDEFGYLAVILSIILGLSVIQLLQGPRPHLQPGDWLGAAAARHRCAGVVGDVSISQSTCLDLSPVRHPPA